MTQFEPACLVRSRVHLPNPHEPCTKPLAWVIRVSCRYTQPTTWHKSGKPRKSATPHYIVSQFWTNSIWQRLDCAWCDSWFDLPTIRAAHEQDVHNVYRRCHSKLETWGALVDHCRKQRCANVCDCCPQQGNISLNTQAFQGHVRACNVCTTCDRHFDPPSNLNHVSSSESWSS